MKFEQTEGKSRAERQALELAADKTALRKRLQEARSVLADRYAKLFGKGRFDFQGRRLIGDNGLVLRWLTRPEPNQPESYHNQQTIRGCVILICQKDKLPADSIG